MENKHPEEHLDNKNITDELESVNEARKHAKNVPNSEDNSDDDAVSTEDSLKKDLAEANDKYVRLYAEFDNYKRRSSKERIELLQSAGKDVINDMLPIIDDFDRAIKAAENTENFDSVKEGILLISQKLKKTLELKGLKAMESINQPFDADLHEAVTKIPAPNDNLKGKVIDEVEKGYFLNDKVLRYAKVVVGS